MDKDQICVNLILLCFYDHSRLELMSVDVKSRINSIVIYSKHWQTI